MTPSGDCLPQIATLHELHDPSGRNLHNVCDRSFTLPVKEAVVNKGHRFVFCVGMRRGGSTLQSQLVAAILGQPSVQLVSQDSVQRFLRTHRNTDHVVIAKTHRYLPEAVELARAGEAQIVYTYRDLRDVVASIVTKYSIPAFAFVHGGLDRLMDEYEAWTSIEGIYLAKYEAMIADLPAETSRLAKFLGVRLSKSQAQAIAEAHCLEQQRTKIRRHAADDGSGRNRFHSKTLLHIDHIQGGGMGRHRETLSAPIVAALEWQSRRWMKVNGYRPQFSRPAQYSAHMLFTLKSALHRCKSFRIR